MKILVLGSGFIGGAIINRLEALGHELLSFSRTPKAGIASRQIVGDIFDFASVQESLRWKPEVLIHTAWITSPGLYKNDPSNIRYSQFSIDLVNSIVRSDIQHLIVLGTCAEYGLRSAPSTAGITPLSPKSLYAQQKVEAFNVIKQIMFDSPAKFTWARIFHPYGPNQDEKRLIPYLIKSLKNGERAKLADISSIYDWITIRDIASAISWILTHEVPTEIDVGTSIGYTNLELLMLLEELIPERILNSEEIRHEFGAREVFVTGLESPLLRSGWRPHDTLRSGLEWVLDS